MTDLHLIEFKGTKNGLIVHMSDQAPFDELIKELSKKYLLSNNFFRDATVIGIYGRKLSDDEKDMVKNILVNKFEMHLKDNILMELDHKTIIEVDENDDIKDNDDVKTCSSTKKNKFQFNRNIRDSKTKLIGGTLRSGYSMSYDGNVVVMGDVNPGAEIYATGNIVVLGHLRGTVHAGCKGDHDTWVMALKLQPTQLRIGALITRSPDDNIVPREPEIAYVSDKMIIIEPYKLK